MIVVVNLTVRVDQTDTFRAFETQAAHIMRRHGGAIERVVVVPPEPGAAEFRELHLVRFPSPAAFAAYRQDPALVTLQALREAAIVRTEIVLGEDGPDYGALPPA